MAELELEQRSSLASYGKLLETLTMIWATTEAAVALWSASRTGSISLAGFGLDSVIEVLSALALWWRMVHEMNHHRRHQAEKLSLKLAGYCLVALAVYVFAEAASDLTRHQAPSVGMAGIAITAAALVLMPLLSREKRRVGRGLGSNAMMTDAKQTDFCTIQAAIVLFGLLCHLLFGISWADGVAALLLVPILLRAGILSLRGQHACGHC